MHQTPPLLQLQQVDVRHAARGKASASDGRSQRAGDDGNYALRQIDIVVEEGEQVAIIGPSGAGKTTLLHTIACAHQPVNGTLKIDGADVWGLSNSDRHRLRRTLFLAPQTPPLPPRQRVITSVLAGKLPSWSFTTALKNLIKPTDPKAAYVALSRFDLEDKLYAHVDELSGGERQRCGLARLLLSDARLLLVDEPLSALDPRLAIQTLTSLQTEAQQRNASLICSLHQVDLARSHFKRIIGLRDGKIYFDSRQVTDEMIDNLYRNARDDAPVIEPVNLRVAIDSNPRCF